MSSLSLVYGYSEGHLWRLQWGGDLEVVAEDGGIDIAWIVEAGLDTKIKKAAKKNS